jgi:hypothetical protein
MHGMSQILHVSNCYGYYQILCILNEYNMKYTCHN